MHICIASWAHTTHTIAMNAMYTIHVFRRRVRADSLVYNWARVVFFYVSELWDIKALEDARARRPRMRAKETDRERDWKKPLERI